MKCPQCGSEEMEKAEQTWGESMWSERVIMRWIYRCVCCETEFIMLYGGRKHLISEGVTPLDRLLVLQSAVSHWADD